MALRLSPEDKTYLRERLRFCRTELLAAAGTPPPATYREALLSLPLTGLVSETEAEGLAALAPLRNSLSHQYLDYKWSAIKKFIATDSAFVHSFLDRLEDLLVHHSD